MELADGCEIMSNPLSRGIQILEVGLADDDRTLGDTWPRATVTRNLTKLSLVLTWNSSVSSH